MNHAFPEDSAERKTYAVFSGLLKYFPHALAEIGRVSYVGGQQHSPGQPLFWDRTKSTDHLDALTRHLIEHASGQTYDSGDGTRVLAKVAWRALAQLQMELESESNDAE